MTVGRSPTRLEVKLVDLAGDIVPVGATGELRRKGYPVMQGYWDDERTYGDDIVIPVSAGASGVSGAALRTVRHIRQRTWRS